MPVRTSARRWTILTGWSTTVAAAIVLALLAGPSPVAAGAVPPSGAASNSAVAAMVVAELHLLDLECLRENDDGTWWGSDEVYITLNGQRVWERGGVDRNDVILIDLRLAFDDLITVQLWEDDGGLRGGDDHMATWYVFAAEVGSGVHKVRSQYTAGSYDLRYEVV